MNTASDHRSPEPAPVRSAWTSRPEPLMERIRAEFLEMPGLKLTLDQAARLFALEKGESTLLLTALLDEGFLRRDLHGRFLRRDIPRRRGRNGAH